MQFLETERLRDGARRFFIDGRRVSPERYRDGQADCLRAGRLDTFTSRTSPTHRRAWSHGSLTV